MFGYKARRHAFESEVRLEIELLRKLHGDEAPRVAREKAARPTNRTARRKVLEEAARRLDGDPAARPGLISRIFAGGDG
ncbi:MAG TPA: hypothetical protein PLF78_04755 [Caulobacter sp.]|nr:hypothetical protein [Caulobacter sp.]